MELDFSPQNLKSRTVAGIFETAMGNAYLSNLSPVGTNQGIDYINPSLKTFKCQTV